MNGIKITVSLLKDDNAVDAFIDEADLPISKEAFGNIFDRMVLLLKEIKKQNADNKNKIRNV